MAGLDQRAGDDATSHRRAWIPRRPRDQALDIQQHAQASKACADLDDSLDAPTALLIQEYAQTRVGGIDEVAKHVHVAAIVNGRHLDAIDDLDAQRCRDASDLGESRDRVVVSDAHHGDAGNVDTLDQRRGCQSAVGGRGMEVKIDQRDVGLAAPRAARAFGRGIRRSVVPGLRWL